MFETGLPACSNEETTARHHPVDGGAACALIKTSRKRGRSQPVPGPGEAAQYDGIPMFAFRFLLYVPPWGLSIGPLVRLLLLG